MNIAIKEDDRAFWLALHRIRGLGPIGQRKLLDAFPTVKQIFSADDSTLKKTGLNKKSRASVYQPDWETIEADLVWLDMPDHHLITINDEAYPTLLREIPDPPVVLFAHGCPEVLKTIQIGMVGSRNPDTAGRKTADEFARELVYAGATVTSGLALGIDGCSHQGALNANGYTIAVTGNGLDMIYPARHKTLAEKIVDNGILVSEFSPGTKPVAANFPRRNRIISGMSTGVLVIQAALRSGSLITARYAMEQGREVFAIPGSIHNPLAKGCHTLIKQGAKLVESVNDIIEELGFLATVVIDENVSRKNDVKNNHYEEKLDVDYKVLLDTMAYDPISVDRLIELTGLTTDSVSSMLLILELRGLVVSQAGGIYMRVN
ncbi:MAG: DNA-protecting protein DprA [Proteobacteria bacterium]|nr:DNA-protecting protein DprA [Pseudomonadota bacterium]